MSSLRPLALVSLSVAAGCPAGAPPQAQPGATAATASPPGNVPTSAATTSSAAVAAPALPGSATAAAAANGDELAACAPPFGRRERVTLAAGEWFETAVGLAARFEGASHDSYEGGETDLLLSLVLWDAAGSTRWLPSAFAPPRFVVMRDRCVRVVSGASGRVVLEIGAARPAGPAAMAPPTVPPCAPADPAWAPLADFGLAAKGGRYHLEVTHGGPNGGWQPVATPRMPHHHASRLVWTNLTEHPVLGDLGSGRLRFDFELRSVHIEPVPGHREWRAEYRARLEAICRP
jgi:hypothetical protein